MLLIYHRTIVPYETQEFFMKKIDKALIQELRRITGLGLMDCKSALEETGGNIEESVELLKKKGAAIAAKRMGKETSQGIIHAYIHPGSQLGVLLEVNCETDFVARTDDMKQFAHDICLQIAATRPLYLKPEDVDPIFLAREKSIIKEQLKDSGKSEKIINQIVEGKLNRIYQDICLLNQSFIKNDQQTVDDVLKTLIAKTGENITLKQFSCFSINS